MKYIKDVLLILVLIFIVYKFSSATTRDTDVERIRQEIVELKKEMGIQNLNSIRYLETRINRLAQTQDEYQSSTFGKISVLENRITPKRADDNIVNNNNINNIVVNK
jgi:hypothetical protein